MSTGTLVEDLETERRLRDGVFDYDPNSFAPGGISGYPATGCRHFVTNGEVIAASNAE